MGRPPVPPAAGSGPRLRVPIARVRTGRESRHCEYGCALADGTCLPARATMGGGGTGLPADALIVQFQTGIAEVCSAAT